MSDDTYPVQWMGPQAVVALPEHIDVSNAGRIREQLLLVINSGAATLIADMTAAVSCDHADADAVGPCLPARRRQRRAAAAGGHRADRPARAQPQRTRSPGLDLPLPGSGHRRRRASSGGPCGARAGQDRG